MIDKISQTKRIAKNTTLLYIRMVIVMCINLYSVSLLLEVLGVEDFGIYNVIIGLISIFLTFTTSLTNTTQRFYSLSLGTEDKAIEQFQKFFSTSVNIYILLSFVIIILAETLGLWFLNNHLKIPEERMTAVNWLFQCSIFSFIFSIVHAPYSAATIAHQDMNVFAIISSIDSVLKLIAIFVIELINYDYLVTYGLILLLISLITMVLYMKIGFSKYPGCKYTVVNDRVLSKEFVTFSGWSLLGSAAGVGMTHINTLFVNIFFGPIVNAARAISFQFNMALNSLVSSFILSIKTPMIKSFSDGAYAYLDDLFYLSNKFIYYFLFMICLPVFIEMETILNTWLRTTDFQMVLFSRLILIYGLILSLNNPISIIIQATGKVKEYYVPVEMLTILSVPATYLLFKLGFPAYSTYITMIVAAIAAHVVRLNRLKKYYVPFSYNVYIKSFMMPAVVISMIISLLVFILHHSINNEMYRVVLVFSVSFISVLLFVFFFGFSKSESKTLKQMIPRFSSKSIGN